MRITKNDLLQNIEYINEHLETNIFELSGAYGGYKLTTKTGNDVLATGYTTKKDLYFNLISFIRGLEYNEYKLIK